MRAALAGLLALLMCAAAVPASAQSASPPTTAEPPPTTAAGPPPTVEDTSPPLAHPGRAGGTPDAVPVHATIEAGRARFSPNGDKRADRLPVRVIATEPTTVTVTVTRAEETLAVLAADRVVAPGTTTLWWSGLASGHRAHADGWVFLHLEARNGYGDLVEQTVHSVIDTTAPSFAWTRIAPRTITGAGPMRLSFTTGREKDRVAVRFEMIGINGARSRRPAVRLPVGPGSVSWAPRRSGNRQLAPGHYFLAAIVGDSSGNQRVTPIQTILVHRAVTTKVLHRLAAAGNRVALTFDDCNDGAAWSSIVRTLERYGTSATFFCNGQSVSRFSALARNTVAHWGWSIGSHSPRHDDMTDLSAAGVRSQLTADRTTWWSAARTTPTPFFRPPYGAYDRDVLSGAGQAGYAYTVLWDVDPRDWERPGSGAIADRVLSRARGGSIVVMHTLPQTAAALPTILAGLRRRGLSPVGMHEMVHVAHV